MSEINRFDCLSALDYRYWDADVARYLSENAFTCYKLKVELALVKALQRRGLCSEAVVAEVAAACEQVTTEEVYEEEKRIHHDIRAMVNCIRRRVSDEAKPFVHMTATSYDIVECANAARTRDVMSHVLLPSLVQLEKILIALALAEAETQQIGRTHGQHAVPITFGFAMAEYISRLGGCIQTLRSLTGELRGKFSGAVGAYNASSLFFDDPEEFEKDVLWDVALQPAEYSTQIVPPEPMTRLLCEVTITAGVLANLADDLRHLQRTEIGEVGEAFEADQVGSSTMPQKRNPINFENTKSCWKIVAPRIGTVFMDQISEHQRDLTNSASARTYGEVIAYVVSMTKRLTRTLGKLRVDRPNLRHNLALQQQLVMAEPLYLLLAAMGHPDAHEKVRLLTLQAHREDRALGELVFEDPELFGYLGKMTDHQRLTLRSIGLYTGRAAERTRVLAEQWKQRLGIA